MYKDRFTGLYHTHFREYDPVHGRWLSEDPAGYQDGLNLYAAYMGVNATDPLGTETRRKQVLDDYQQYRRFIAEAPFSFEGNPVQWHLDEFDTLPPGLSGRPVWQIQAQHDAALLRDLQNRPIQRSGHDSFGHTAQHFFLDVAGTLDPTPGQPVDAAHAAIRASHGETADAALTGASVALPFAGDVFKLFRWADEGIDAANSTIRSNVMTNIAENRTALSSSKYNGFKYERAYNFYRQSGIPHRATVEELYGINFAKSVDVVELPANYITQQYVRIGRTGKNYSGVGNYYAEVGSSATGVGLNPANRMIGIFSSSDKVKVLRSTASPITDTWTVPGSPFSTTGGQIQFFTTDKAGMTSGFTQFYVP